MDPCEGRKVLIIDDERFIRDMIKLVLRAVSRFDIAEADDGDTGLVQTDEFRPDVVLCDITMPRMGGLQYVAMLRKHPDARLRSTPVIILTGHAEEATVQDAVRLQVNGFLVKPVSPKSLSGPLRKILTQRVPEPD